MPPPAAPAAAPPPAPTKSRGGKGCLIAAIVGVVLLVVIGVGVVIGGRILIDKASDTLQNIGGSASPSSYEIKAEECTFDGIAASFSGTIKNTTGSTKNFLLFASVTDSNGEDLGALPVVITGLAPGASKQWDFTVFGEPQGEITCKIQSVNNALN